MINTKYREDGTIEVTTTDADPYLAEERARVDVQLQAALDAERQRPGGDPAPVVFVIIEGGRAEQLRADLGPGIALERGLGTSHVCDRDKARRLLGKLWPSHVVNRWFRTPLQNWPVYHWMVQFEREEVMFTQSRTARDISGK